jgi:hypothetical protein
MSPRERVGDLTQLVQNLLQQREVTCTQIRLPLGKDLVERPVCHCDRTAAAPLDHDQPGTTIRRVWNSTNISQAFQLIDHHPGTLLTHLCLVGEVRETRTVRGNPLEYPALGESPVIEPGVLESSEHPVLGVSVWDEQRHPQIDSLLVVHTALGSVRPTDPTTFTPYDNAARLHHHQSGSGRPRTEAGGPAPHLDVPTDFTVVTVAFCGRAIIVMIID